MSAIPEARILVIPPPPIQGIGNAAGFAMQVQLRDGNADFGKLQAITGAIVANAQTQSALQRVSSSFRSMVPQFDVEVDRVKTQTLHVTTDQIFSTLSSYLGSSYVNQFNKFGRTFQVYAQADAQFRLTPRDIENLMVRNSQGDMIPLGTVATITPSVGPSLISLYNLYPSATVIGLPAAGLQLRPVDGADGGDRRQDPAAGHRLSNGRRCRTRRRSSAARSTRRSASRCCWSIWCWPDNMRAGTRRSR